MIRTRVKICGITSARDASLAVNGGADALGFIFYPPSPRYVSPEVASVIVAGLPPILTTVGVFVDESAEFINQVMRKTKLAMVQLHGDETPDLGDQLERPYIKGVRMREGIDLEDIEGQYASAKALLLDSYKPGVVGGTGSVFDWQRSEGVRHKPLILAGGLDAANVKSVIENYRPYAIDICSGVEAEKGIKSPVKINELFAQIKDAKYSL